MARFKHYNYEQTKMIPLRFADQIQPGSFEYTLNHVVYNELDLGVFESRHRNDHNGAPAYDPHSETCRCPVGKEIKRAGSRESSYTLSRLSEGMSSVLVAI